MLARGSRATAHLWGPCQLLGGEPRSRWPQGVSATGRRGVEVSDRASLPCCPRAPTVMPPAGRRLAVAEEGDLDHIANSFALSDHRSWSPVQTEHLTTGAITRTLRRQRLAQRAPQAYPGPIPGPTDTEGRHATPRWPRNLGARRRLGVTTLTFRSLPPAVAAPPRSLTCRRQGKGKGRCGARRRSRSTTCHRLR